jgi:hypothetical protein
LIATLIARETVFAHLTTTAVARFVSTLLIAAFFNYLYQVKQRTYLLAWAAGWYLLAASALCFVLEPALGVPEWLPILDQWMVAVGVLALFYAVRLYANARPWTGAFLGAAAVYAVWTIAFGLGKVSISPALGIGLVLLGIAWVFWRESRQQDSHADLFLALIFLAWAPVPIAGSHFALGTTARQNVGVFAGAAELLVAGLMVMAVYEEEKWSATWSR